jgi:hypothetical protein
MTTYHIVYAEREFARIMGDPVLCIIDAFSEQEALKNCAVRSGIMEVKAILAKTKVQNTDHHTETE